MGRTEHLSKAQARLLERELAFNIPGIQRRQAEPVHVPEPQVVLPRRAATVVQQKAMKPQPPAQPRPVLPKAFYLDFLKYLGNQLEDPEDQGEDPSESMPGSFPSPASPSTQSTKASRNFAIKDWLKPRGDIEVWHSTALWVKCESYKPESGESDSNIFDMVIKPVVKKALESGFAPSSIREILCFAQCPHTGNTLLHLAARRGYDDFARILVNVTWNEPSETGDNLYLGWLNKRNSNGETAFLVAVRHQRWNMVQDIFLNNKYEAWFSPYLADNQGLTVFNVLSKQREAIRAMLSRAQDNLAKHGAIIDEVFRVGDTWKETA